MGRPLKTAKANNKGTGFNNPTANPYGVVGGNTAIDGPQIQIRVRVAGQTEDVGYIVRQKGRKKFMVRDDSGKVGTCVLVDKDSGTLAEGEMTVTAVMDDSGAVRLARISNRWGIDFTNTKHILTFNAPAANVNGYELVQVDSD